MAVKTSRIPWAAPNVHVGCVDAGVDKSRGTMQLGSACLPCIMNPVPSFGRFLAVELRPFGPRSADWAHPRMLWSVPVQRLKQRLTALSALEIA